MEYTVHINKIYLVVLSVLIVYILESNAESEFLSDISDTFSKMWENMKRAIRKPVRIKRLGRGGRKKSTTTTITTKSPPRPALLRFGDIDTRSERTVMLDLTGERLLLPVLSTPRWLSRRQWVYLQKPKFASNRYRFAVSRE